MSNVPLFVTGTDTGVGKTHVSRGILCALSRTQIQCVPLKLVETGCRDGQPEDGLALARAARFEHAMDRVSPLRFEMPASPRWAAQHEQRSITFAMLAEQVERAAMLGERMLIEGAGGVLTPLGTEGTLGDFIATLHARVVIVARDALGTINHTLLTIEALRQRNLTVAAVVLNSVGSEISSLDHATQLAQVTIGIPIFGPLQWGVESSDDAIADALGAIGLTPGVIVGQLFGQRAG